MTQPLLCDDFSIIIDEFISFITYFICNLVVFFIFYINIKIMKKILIFLIFGILSSFALFAQEKGSTELSISVRNLTIDKKKMQIKYEADAGRMTSVYNTYYFDYKNFVKVVGTDKPKNDFNLLITIQKTKSEKSDGNKKGAVPNGGFTYIHNLATAVKVIKPNNNSSSNSSENSEKEMVLDVSVSKLSIDKKNNFVIYEPDQGRMVAVTKSYYFDRTNFVKIVGTDAPKKNLKLKISIVKEIKENNPGDSKGAVPDGGFKRNVYASKVIQVVK